MRGCSCFFFIAPQFLLAAGADANYMINETSVVGDVMSNTMALRSEKAKGKRLKTIDALINGGLKLEENYFMCRLNFRRHVGKARMEDLFKKNLWASDACEMLHVATNDADIELTKTLLKAGVLTNTTTKVEGYTPTHTAALSRNLEVLKLVVEAGAPLEDKDKEDSTPLATAASIGFSAGVEYLMEKNVIPSTLDQKGYSPILLAAYADDEASINRMLATGISPNTGNSNYGVTLLHLVAAFKEKKKAYRMTKSLLAQGAFPKASNVGNTPATDAAVAGHSEVMDMLIEHGDNVQDQWLHPRNEKPPVSLLAHVVETVNDVELFNKLIDNNLDVHAKGANATNLLHLASYVHRKDFIKLLVEEHGMDINEPDNSGRTPLMHACSLPPDSQFGGKTIPADIVHAQALETIFSLGADPEKQVNGGQAIMYACETAHEAAYNKLKKQYKVDETMKISDGKGGQITLKECLNKAKDKLQKQKTRKMLDNFMGQASQAAGNAGKFVEDSVSSAALGF